MANSKAVENDREIVSQEEGEKQAMAGGHGDLMLGGKTGEETTVKNGPPSDPSHHVALYFPPSGQVCHSV